MNLKDLMDDSLPFDPLKVMDPRLDQREFNRVAAWLRTAEPTVRLQFLRDCIGLRGPMLRLATSVVNARNEALDLFQRGLNTIQVPNSTATKLWLRFGVTKLGARRAIQEIRDRIDTQPHVVDMAIYWLPSMLTRETAGHQELDALVVLAKSKKIIRPVVQIKMPDGSTLYGDRYASE